MHPENLQCNKKLVQMSRIHLSYTILKDYCESVVQLVIWLWVLQNCRFAYINSTVCKLTRIVSLRLEFSRVLLQVMG